MEYELEFLTALSDEDVKEVLQDYSESERNKIYSMIQSKRGQIKFDVPILDDADASIWYEPDVPISDDHLLALRYQEEEQARIRQKEDDAKLARALADIPDDAELAGDLESSFADGVDTSSMPNCKTCPNCGAIYSIVKEEYFCTIFRCIKITPLGFAEGVTAKGEKLRDNTIQHASREEIEYWRSKRWFANSCGYPLQMRNDELHVITNENGELMWL